MIGWRSGVFVCCNNAECLHAPKSKVGRMTRVYELLKAHGDPEHSDTQKEMLRHLQCVQVPSEEREGVEVLKRLHFEQFCTFVTPKSERG